ncbi:hypothetical protein ABG067_005010 [Albugo candida]
MSKRDKVKRTTSSVLFSDETLQRRYGSIINKSKLVAHDGEKASSNDTGDDPFVKNLTLDGVKEGTYMLCKHSDDLLGHRARQAFRERAASIRGENGIYYFLKELIQTFGCERELGDALITSEALRNSISLDIHEFRKMIMSDPAFAVAIASDQIDALFHRIERDTCSLITHQELLEFCLLDRSQLRLLLYKYRKHLKHLKLSEVETKEYFERMVSTEANYVSPELLHAAIARELDVILTTGETSYLLTLMDSDHDGFVRINDFEYLLQSEQNVQNLIYPPKEDAIVDIRISATESDEIGFQRDGFAQLLPGISDKASGGNNMFLWFKSASREEGKTGIERIRYANTSRDTQLVAKGYTCLLQDIGAGGLFSKHLFIWISHTVPNMPNSSELIDMCVTVGDLNDQADARLWLPMFRGFKLIPGNLNTNSSKSGIFLWVRRRHKLGSSLRNIDIIEPHSWTQDVLSSETSLDSEYSLSLFHDSWKFLSHLDELEVHVRKTLRRNCPRDQDTALNFARLFQTFVNKNVQKLTRPQLVQGMESLGVKINKKDLQHLWERMNPTDSKFLSLENFSRFLKLTDTEIDDVLTMFQRNLTAHAGSNGPNYRLIFQSHNALGDGKLSRTDFERLFAFQYSNFTNSELSQVIMRLDVNKDGIVDYSDFLRYVTGLCDESCRVANRISDAAEVFRSWVIEKQSRKHVKNGKIDIGIAWRALKPKHGLIDPITIDHILRESNIRLQATHIGQVVILIAPATKGLVTQEMLQEFANYLPRKITSVAYDMKKLFSCFSSSNDANLSSDAPSAPSSGSVFDRLNVERNGKLTLVKLWEQVRALSIEKNVAALCPNLRDFTYLVQWTGADCGGHGSILIDRFLAAVLGIQERRNMKIEFITHYDSPQFCDGVQILRQELRRCAKTLDGKYNFRIPFDLLDKDKSGCIVASEFEEAIRELGIQKYMSDQEVKSLMRRFDLNADGGIDFDEFVRFNLAESSSSVSAASPDFDNKREYLSRERRDTEDGSDVNAVLQKIVMQEHLNSSTIVTFCASMQRMFGILDRESTGSISTTTFQQVIKELGLLSDEDDDMKKLVDAFSCDQLQKKMYYREFCDKLEQCALLKGYHSRNEEEVSSEVHIHSDITNRPDEAMKLLRRLHAQYCDLLRHLPKEEPEICKDVFREVFEIEDDCKNRFISLNVEELREWTGADCGGHGSILIDRFLAAVLGIQERRNMKIEFITHYDSPQFCDGVQILRQELRRCAKTLDGKYNFRIPFDLLDKDKSGCIVASEFEEAIRELGIQKYMSDQEVKSLMRRFDLNADGGIDFDEFVRFNLAESSSSVSAASPDFDNKREYLSRERRDTEDGSDVNAVLQKIVMQEHLNSSTIVTFCASMQRMFGILDRESTGSISTTTFQQVIKELGLLSDEDDDMKKLVDAFSCDQLQKKMYYREFCDKLEQCALLKGYHSRNEEEVSSEVHIHSDITNRPDEAMKLLRRLHAQYCDLLRHLPKEEPEICKDVFREVFEIEDDCKNRFISLNVEELREVLWRAGLRHPYLRDELEILLQCFTVVKENGTGFSAQLFLDLLDKGPTPTFLTTSTEHVSVLFEDHVRRLQRVLQDYIDASGEGVNSQERLISLFTQCDADRNGTISRKEFMFMLDKAGLRSHFKRGGKDEALLLHFMDVNGDGEVGIDEFVTFVKNANINVVKEKAEGKLEDNDKKLENTLSQSITRTESLGSSHVDQVEQKPNEELDKEPEDQKTPLQTAKKLIESEEKSHLKLVREIAICNGKLPEKFPFKCLFEKHCITMTTTTKDKLEERCMPPRKAVSVDIFQDIFGRFVQELMKERIKFNMRTFDATRVLLPYVRTINDSESFVSYELFLRDLKYAEFDIKQSNAKETKGSQSQVRLACNNKNTRAYLAHKVIARAIQDAYQNEKELRSFKLQLECLKNEREEKRSHKLEGQSSTEQDVFDALIRLGLRLDAQDLEQCILPKIEESSELGCSSGSFSYNIDSLLTIVQEELYAAVEVEKDAVGNVTKKSLRLSQSLRSRLVRCFVNAAQNNISGRKLLERCDPNKTGIISVVECQTVLRVLDCEISTNDMNEIEQQFGTREKNGCSLQIRYTDLLNLLEHMEAQERQYHDRKHPCSPQKESPRRHLSQKIGNSQEPILSTNCSMQDHKALRERLKYALMEVTRLRGVTLEQFKKSVRSYDVNGTGCSSGSFSYNIDSLLTIVQEELYAAVEVEKDAVGNVTKKSLRLSQSLRSRLVRCFVNAAQNNISGRKLLERCDPNKTGIISVVECQTVLRVLDCEISTNDMNEIEQQFGTREKNGCSLQIRYTDLLNLLEHMEAQERQYHDRKHPCSPQKESPRRHLSQKIGNSQEPILSTNCSMQDHKALRERLKYALMEVTRLRGVTLEQFKKSVRSYDVNGTGFVTVDGFLAALRRLDIILNAEAAETMNRCFRIGGLQSDRIDYIELFDMLEKREVVNLDTLFGSIPIQSKCNPLSRSAYHQVSDRATKSPVKQHRTSLASPVRLSQPLKPADRAASHCVHDKTNDKNWACHVCFHIQTKPTRNCEICAAENPAKSSNQALQQCPKCYYRNSRNSRKCNLCHSLLHKRRM